ncbi:MAG TPA: phosphocholine cytidylyltransferase family protein [Polyangia bacterium]
MTNLNSRTNLTAVILAAGVGSRMGSLTATRPKCLLEVAPGETVLGLMLDRLFETGCVGRVVVVTGHRADGVEDFVKGHRHGSRTEVFFNPFFEVSNNLHSLWLARGALAQGGLIVNGDDIFHPALINRALGAMGDVSVTINRKRRYDADDMKVKLLGQRLTRIGKDIALDEADGEAIGLIRLSATGASWMAQSLERIVRSGERNVFYLRAVQRLIDDGRPVRAADITPIPWAEIDEPKDLESARARAFEWLPRALSPSEHAGTREAA